ncbi:hypothetical protein D3C71_532700 [compost metagenome]
MIKFDAVCIGNVASTLDLKYAHERLNQMIFSDDCSGPIKRIGRVASPVTTVTPIVSRRENLQA